MDDLLIRLTPGPTLPIAPSVLGAREALASATTALLGIADERLDEPWQWLAGGGEVELRYAFYRSYEALERAAGDVGRTFERTRAERSPAAALFADSTAARWRLHGALAALDDASLDADPGGGEWTIRRTLAHIINSQRAYGWFTAWWYSRALEAEFPDSVPDTVAEASGFPDETSEGGGSLADLRRRLDSILDLSAGRFASLGEEDLAIRARWQGLPVNVGFRLGRWSSHIAEHTVQVDKTLAWLRHEPTEAERMGRILHDAYGRLEATVFGRPPEALERQLDGGRSPADVFGQVSAELVAVSRSAAEAARASASGV